MNRSISISLSVIFEDLFAKDEDLDPDLNIATQSLFFKRDSTETSRFCSPITDEDLMTKISNRVPKKTQQSNNWSLRFYQEWARHRNAHPDTVISGRNVPEELISATNEDLNYWLSRFIMEVRRKDGTPYPPNTLTNIMSGLQRHLREKGRNVGFFKKDDTEFMLFRKSLDSRMKELAAAGVGTEKKRADPITVADEDRLWTKVFGDNTSLGMSYAVFFYNCKLFGFRGMDEHRNLAAEQFQVKADTVGKYINFSGRVCKNVQGGLDQRRIEPKLIKHFEQSGNPPASHGLEPDPEAGPELPVIPGDFRTTFMTSLRDVAR